MSAARSEAHPLNTLHQQLAAVYRRVTFRTALLIEINRDLRVLIERMERPRSAAPQPPQIATTGQSQVAQKPSAPSQTPKALVQPPNTEKVNKIPQSQELTEKPTTTPNEEIPDRISAILDLAKKTRQLEPKPTRPQSPILLTRSSPRTSMAANEAPRSNAKNPAVSSRSSSVPTKRPGREVPPPPTIKPKIQPHPKLVQKPAPPNPRQPASAPDSSTMPRQPSPQQQPTKAENADPPKIINEQTQEQSQVPSRTTPDASRRRSPVSIQDVKPVHNAGQEQTQEDATETQQSEAIDPDLIKQERFWAQLNQHTGQSSRQGVVGKTKSIFIERLESRFEYLSQGIPSVQDFFMLLDLDRRCQSLLRLFHDHIGFLDEPLTEASTQEEIFLKWYMVNKLQRACADVFSLYQQMKARYIMRKASILRHDTIMDTVSQIIDEKDEDLPPSVGWFNWWLPVGIPISSAVLTYLKKQKEYSILKDGRRLYLYNKFENVLYTSFLRNELQRILLSDFVKAQIYEYLCTMQKTKPSKDALRILQLCHGLIRHQGKKFVTFVANTTE